MSMWIFANTFEYIIIHKYICSKTRQDKTYIVNKTTCFDIVQRGSYDDSGEYLQETGDRPTHFRDSEKSGRKILSVFFVLQKKRTLSCTTLLVDVTKIVLLWQLLDQQKLCQLFLLALKRGRLIFLTSFQGSHLDVYMRKRKSLNYSESLSSSKW